MPRFHLHLCFLAPDFPSPPPKPPTTPKISLEIPHRLPLQTPPPNFPQSNLQETTPRPQKLRHTPKVTPGTKDAPIINHFGVCTFPNVPVGFRSTGLNMRNPGHSALLCPHCFCHPGGWKTQTIMSSGFSGSDFVGRANAQGTTYLPTTSKQVQNGGSNHPPVFGMLDICVRL